MSDDIKKNWQEIADSESEIDSFDEFTDGKDEKSDIDITDNDSSELLTKPSYSELEERLAKSEQLASENWEKSVRAVAELDNVRRRLERDVTNAHKYGIEKFVDGLLPCIDSLEQALTLVDNDDEKTKSMVEGIELTLKLLLDVFEKFGVKQLNPEGEIFDPKQHEAMAMQPAEGLKANTIITVFQKGYLLNDRVVRPARVVVAKA